MYSPAAAQPNQAMDPWTSYVQLMPYGVEIPNRVFVGGLSKSMTELELMECFSQFGKVLDSKIITFTDGSSKGYGFVTYETGEEAASVYCKGSLFYKEKKLNVSKAIRKQGGQYTKANQEYVNGQRTIYLHPSGYLVSQQDGAWVFEQPSPHSQPAKRILPQPYYNPMLLPGNQTQYLQTEPLAPPGTPGISNYLPPPNTMAQGEVYSTSYYHALPSPTYSYIAEPLPTPEHSQQQPKPIYPVENTTTVTANALPLPPPPQEPLESSGDNPRSSPQSGDKDAENSDKNEASTEENTDKQIAALEKQTHQLSLDAPVNSEQHSSPKPVHNPTTNGFVRKQYFNSSHQSKRPPRYLQRCPPTLSRPPHVNLPSPIFQPAVQYSYPPTHPYQAPMAYSTAPQTMRPPQYPMNPVSNISTLNFTPPISPNLSTL